MNSLYNILFNFLMGLLDTFVDVGNWLTSPLFAGLTPLTLISGGGLIVIITIWVVKLLNPLS